MPEHRCDPRAVATGRPGPVTTSRVLGLLFAMLPNVGDDGDAHPAVTELYGCEDCHFAVINGLVAMLAGIMNHLPDDIYQQTVTALQQELLTALDEIAADEE